MSGFIQSLNFFFTGNYNADDGNNNITAVGFGGTVRAYGGNDTVNTMSFYTKVEDTWGHLDLWGLAGGIEVQKSGWGNINAHALAINSYINHWGQTGDVNFYGGVLNSNIYRSGQSGHVRFYGAAGSSYIEHNTTTGDTTVTGLFGSSVVKRNGTKGNVTFQGGTLNSAIYSNVSEGDVNVYGAAANSIIYRNGVKGNVTLYGVVGSSYIEHNATQGNVTVGALGLSNVIKRKGSVGNVVAMGAGVANVISMEVNQGDLNVYLLGGANVITRTGKGRSTIAVGGLANIITTGDSEDTVVAYGGTNVVKAGYKGNDNITVGGGLNVVMVGHGNNTITALGGANIVLSGHGNNDILAGGGANVVMNGNGRLKAQAFGLLNVVLTGDGKSDIEAVGGLNIVMAGNGLVPLASASSKLGRYANTDYIQQAQAGAPGQVAVVKAPPAWGLPITHGRLGSDDPFLMVDGALDSSKLLISQSVMLTQGKTYEFSTYVATNDADLRLQLNVNGIDVGGSMRAQYTSANGGWQKVTVQFVAESAGVATVGLRSLNTTWGANDFALDDIRLMEFDLWRNGGFSDPSLFNQTPTFLMGGTWIGAARVAQSTYAPAKGYPQTFLVYLYDGTYTKAIDVRATVTQDGQISFNKVVGSAKYWLGDVAAFLSQGIQPAGVSFTNNESSYILSQAPSISSISTDYIQQAQVDMSSEVAVVKIPPAWGLPIARARSGSDDPYFLMVDGATDNSKLVIKQSVALTQGKTYEFSTYVATNDANLQLQLSVNSKSMGTPMQAQYTTANEGWQKVTAQFVAESTGVTTVGLRSLNTTWGANDFALDDMSLREVPSRSDTKVGMANPFADSALWGGADFNKLFGQTGKEVKFFIDGYWFKLIMDNKEPLEAQSTFAPSKGYPQVFKVYYVHAWYTFAMEVQATVRDDGEVSFNRVQGSGRWGHTTAETTASLSKGMFPASFTQTHDEAIVVGKTEGRISALRTDYLQQPEVMMPGHVSIMKGSAKWGVPVKGGIDGNDDAYLMVDGSMDASKLILKQNVMLGKGQTYMFSTCVATNDANLQLQLSVNGKDVGIPLQASYTPNDGWKRFTMSFVADSTGMVTVGLRSLNTTVGANDFALDGLVLKEVPADPGKVEATANQNTNLWTDGGFNTSYSLPTQTQNTEVAGNTIRAYSFGNLVMSGSGDDRIRAGGPLGWVTNTVGLSAADSFEFDRIMVVGSDVLDTLAKTSLNLVSLLALTAVDNLGNIVIAGEGNNKVKTYGGLNFVQTGSGNDEVSMVGAGNCAVVGNGNNRVFAVGGVNFVWGGDGNDEMQCIGGANVFVAGGGNNRMTALGTGNVFIGAGGNDNAFMAGTGNVFIAGGGNNVAFMVGVGNFMQGASGDDKVIGIGAIGNAFILGDGNNTVGALGGQANIVWTGNGNDTVVSIAPSIGNLLLLGDGDNFAMAAGQANLVITGDGRDSVLSLGQYNILSTASGKDNVVALGQTNVVLTGGDDDVACLVGQTNFLMAGWGNDITTAIGKDNIVLTEGGNDTALVIGQSNYVFGGGGDDIIAAFGETNYLLAGSGADIALVFGKKNVVATDNEIVITEDDLPWKESETVKQFNDKGKDWSKDLSMDVSTQAEFKISGDLQFYFPDIEFSSADKPDWKMPSVTLPQFDYQLPTMQELKAAPTYEYGTLGNYGLPTISLPKFSSPELQIPGITVPSFSFPNFEKETGLKLDSFKANFYLDFSVSSDWAGVLGNSFCDLVGLPKSDGNSNKLLGTKLNVQPSLSGNANYNGADLTGKGTYSESSSINVVVAQAESKNKGEANAKANTNGENYAGASGNTYANASVWNNAEQATNDQKWTEGAPVPGKPSSASAKKVRYIVMVKPDATAWDPAELTVMSKGKNVALGKVVYVGNQGAAEPAANLVDGNTGSYYHDEYRYGPIPKNQWVMVDLGQEYTIDSVSLTSRAGFTDRQSNVKIYQSEKNFLTSMSLTPGVQMSDTQVADLDKGVYNDTKIMQVANKNEQSSITRDLTGTMYQLPSLSFGDVELPSFQLNGFDMSGYSQLLGDVFSGRDFFGVTLPAFSIPDFKVPNFNLNDYVADGSTNALTIKGRSFELPRLELPRIAGLNIISRLPTFSNFDFHRGSGDVALVGGQENRVMTGAGDDLALVTGQTNTLIMGDGNDAALMFGEKNNFRGGAGDDLVIAGGSENSLKGQDGKDLMIALGLKNKMDGGGGDDALIAVGNTNELDGGSGKDLMVAIGNENKIGCKADTGTGDGDDTIIALGLTNKIKAGSGADWVLTVGLENSIDLGGGNDLACVVGWSNNVIGDSADTDNGADTMLVAGGKNAIQGNGGDDLMLVAGLANNIQAGNGADVVVAAGLAQFISAGDGNDIVVAMGAGNVITGGLGDDVIYAAGLLNTVFAGDGNDVLFAFGGGSILNGGADNDVYLSQGMASRTLQSQNKLNDATAMIHTALDALNSGTQSISSETTPDQVADYQTQKGGGVVNYVSGNGNNVFYSGFETTVVDAGSGDDRFHFYLGDAHMTVNSGSGADKLYIHANVNEYADYGLSTNIELSNLYYQASNKALSICRGNVTYGRIILADFDSNDTVSLLMTGGQSMDVLLSSLQAPAGSQSNTQFWAPTMPTQTGPYFNPDLTTLYDQMQLALKINSVVL